MKLGSFRQHEYDPSGAPRTYFIRQKDVVNELASIATSLARPYQPLSINALSLRCIYLLVMLFLAWPNSPLIR